MASNDTSNDTRAAVYRRRLLEELEGCDSLERFVTVQSRLLEELAPWEDELAPAARERLLVELQRATIVVARQLGLGRPLQEHRDSYEFALQDVLRAGPRPQSLDELRARAQTLDKMSFLPQGELATLVAVGCSGWYALERGLPKGQSLAAVPGALLADDLEHFVLLSGRDGADDDRQLLLDFLEGCYVTDSWGALVFRRPDAILPLSGEEAGPFLTRLVRDDFVHRQLPAVERQLWSELEQRR